MLQINICNYENIFKILLRKSLYKNLKVQNSHRDAKYSIGDIVNNIVIMMFGVR